MRSNESAKKLIESLLNPRGKKFEFRGCPRCGRDKMDAEHPCRNALSRYANVYICNDCGLDEAFRDYLDVGPLPPKEWAFVRMYDDMYGD